MKKLITCAALLFAFTASVFAWECPLNPDRFPSVGASFTGAHRTDTEV